MRIIEWIQFIAGIALIFGGLGIFLIQLIGVIKFKYVLNRMHAAAMGDTMGIGLCLLGAIVLTGLNFTSLKLAMVIIFLWLASPVSSHLISRLEVTKRRTTMQIFEYVLLIFLVACAISVSFSKNLLNSIIIFMSYSLVMSVIWVLLESPDLAVTEAAVGAGVTSLLFFMTLKKIHAMKEEGEKDE